MFDCADDLSRTGVEAASAAYQDFLTAHPEHALATEAAGNLLSDGAYCQYPAAYPGAPAYEGGGPHALWTSGIDPDEYDFPDSWQAETTDQTVSSPTVPEHTRQKNSLIPAETVRGGAETG